MWISEKGREIGFAELIDPSRTAVVVIDVQNDFCHPDGAYGRTGANNETMPAMADKIARLVQAAQDRGVLTIFVRATYDQEVTSGPLAHNRHRLGLHQSICLEGTWGADWYGKIAPQGGANELTLTKHRFDAFQGTPLDLYLRTNGIKTVVVAGVATSGCVESTVRTAFFRDYFVVVPRDCVAEPSPDGHQASLNVMGRCFARVADVDEVVEVWRAINEPSTLGWSNEARAARASDRSNHPALLLVDVPNHDAVTDRLVAEARRNSIPILHARFANIAVGRGLNGTSIGDIETSPWVDGALRIERQRMSAFADTRLDLLLRTNNVSCLAVVAREWDLAATVFHALDMDYEVIVAHADDRAATAPQDPTIKLLTAAGARLAPVREIAALWQRAASQSVQAA